jgi:hypothetical protein
MYCRLSIADFRLVTGDKANWQSEIGNPTAHPLPQTVLTSLPVLTRIGLVNNDNEFLNRQKAM